MSRKLACILASIACGSALTAAAAETVSGRYVHIMLPGSARTLSLAEVQVFSGGKNVALKRPAVQTTTGHGGVAGRAVDGDTDGNWKKGTITHTAGQTEPVWEVDLGKARAIEKISLWNRDGTESRLNDVRVSILDAKRKVVWGASVARPGSGATHLATEAFPTCPWAGKRVAKIVPGKAQGGRRAPRDRRARKSKRRAPAPAVTVTTGTPQSLRRAIEHLAATFGPRYPKGASYLKRLASVEKQMQADKDAGRAAFEALQREALLANPLLDFDKLLLVRRAGNVTKSLPANWQGNCMLARSGFDNEIAVLSPLRPDGKLTTLHKPTNGSFVGDVDLHWDGRRMLFSQIGRNGKWQVCEIGVDGKGLREVTRDEIAEFDNYDAAYLPDDRVVFASSAVCHGVPCVGGKTPVSNLYRMGADGGSVRQLCFDQDHNWHPSVMHDGSVLFTRWEYTDTPHYFTRLLFRMNPDGTGQFEYYGSNSFWPNSIFYARQIPGHPTRVVAVVSGHHGDRRMGELVIFDTAKGRQEADGVVQRIPGYGKRVEPVIKDRLVGGVYPRFLTPYPLSGEYFLVSAQLSPRMDWGIYLVDVFDNLTRIHDVPRESLLEPIPLRPRPRPPVIPDRVDLRRKDALVYLLDVYQGPGLRGVPRGTVKKLRVFEYHYAYNHTGGHIHVGVEGPWDVKRILGTVGVEPDGSAVFRVPANTPLAIQPLDADGEALQVMRSWFTAMPGEMLSCVGCHERQSDCPPLAQARALRRKPSEIAPWHGRLRGFSFAREVQPVLDRFCVGCHDGTRKDRPDFSNATAADATTTMRRQKFKFTRSYMALHPYVRRPGPESDYHLLAPCEYRANTSELVQMLRKGHHGVRLDAEAWDRLITWIDLNVPDHGTWAEQRGGQPVGASHEARLRMRRLYANIADDPEAVPAPRQRAKFVAPRAPRQPDGSAPAVAGWPFGPDEAKRRQAAAGAATSRTLDLGDGVTMDLVLVPAGEFVLGDPTGEADELPRAKVAIDRPFWIGRTEVTNRQYRRFDPRHDSRYLDQQWKDHTTPGYPANEPNQPVIRVSWDEATAFCRWLAERSGQAVALPTEAEWEYAARAGTDTPLPWGTTDADFSPWANVADASIQLLAVRGVNPKPLKNAPPTMDFVPREARFNDAQRIVCDVGTYRPNAWGLLDMHGNVAEWTRSAYRPYPYRDDGRNAPTAAGDRVVRGGSWRDRPKRCRSAFRLNYPKWQKVFNVGFRVVVPAGPGRPAPSAVAAKR